MKSYFPGNERKKGVGVRIFFQMKGVMENGKTIIDKNSGSLGAPEWLSWLSVDS